MVESKKVNPKGGMLLTFEALIAIVVLFSSIFFLTTFYYEENISSEEQHFSSDLTQILANIKLSELNNQQVTLLLNAENVTELNRTILEQTLRFKVEGKDLSASQLLNYTLSGLPNTNNYGIWMEGYSDPLFSESHGNGTNIISTKSLVSGIEKNRTIEGFSSRVFLSKINQKTDTAYLYFGGYEGDGTLTKLLILPNQIDSLISAKLELNAEGNFSLYINNNFSGYYLPSGGTTANEWTLNQSYLNHFSSGNNTIKIVFNSTSKYIGGGYLKVKYNSQLVDTNLNPTKETFYFPGVEGIINIYSSVYVPGTLTNMTVFLHYLSDYKLFLNIGDRLVYMDNSSSEKRITINDSELKQLLNYDLLSNQTVPLRIALRNVSLIKYGFGGTADSVLVTDISGSMSDCAIYNSPLICRYNCFWGGSKSCTVALQSQCTGNVCGGSCVFPYGHYLVCNKTKMDVAKEADKEFIDIVLGTPGNRAGLVSYSTSTGSTYNLTNNTSPLTSQINSYSPSGNTCICCGVISAKNILINQSNISRSKSMLVMTDGEANVGCNLNSVPDYDSDGNTNNDPQDQAVHAACQAYNLSNITVYTVGFGEITLSAQNTLNSMAACGGGQYVYTNVTNLTTIYQGIAQTIVNLSYSAQKITSIFNVSTTLYPDSYIEYQYLSNEVQEYGRIPLTIETNKFNNNLSEYNLTIPNNAKIYQAKITSYSGDRWTNLGLIKVNGTWQSFFNLSRYNTTYENLGDPYTLNIPISQLSYGNNSLRISTGYTSGNYSVGSSEDRIIYTAGIAINMNYSNIESQAEGCLWTIKFEDGTNSSIAVPQDYVGGKQCNFTNQTNCNTYTDSISNSVCQLLSQLDLDGNGNIPVKFGSEEINVETTTIGKIPFMWGPTILEVRAWK
jgi:hypothetical protein